MTKHSCPDGGAGPRQVAIPAIAIALAGLLFASIPSHAVAQQADRGHQLAERWCSSCHAVDEGQVGKTPAPPFPSIAAEHHGDRRWLRAWLMSPHPSMPDMSLSRIEIADVIAYLEALQAKKPR